MGFFKKKLKKEPSNSFKESGPPNINMDNQEDNTNLSKEQKDF